MLLSDCYQLSKTGNKFFDVIVRDEYYVPDIRECAQRCLQEEYCKSFAFRIQNVVYTSSSAMNCQLTALTVSQTLSSDLTADSTWNIYQRDLSSTCDDGGPFGGGGGGGGILNPSGSLL